MTFFYVFRRSESRHSPTSSGRVEGTSPPNIVALVFNFVVIKLTKVNLYNNLWNNRRTKGFG